MQLSGTIKTVEKLREGKRKKGGTWVLSKVTPEKGDPFKTFDKSVIGSEGLEFEAIIEKTEYGFNAEKIDVIGSKAEDTSFTETPAETPGIETPRAVPVGSSRDDKVIFILCAAIELHGYLTGGRNLDYMPTINELYAKYKAIFDMS